MSKCLVVVAVGHLFVLATVSPDRHFKIWSNYERALKWSWLCFSGIVRPCYFYLSKGPMFRVALNQGHFFWSFHPKAIKKNIHFSL
jgi:hypothetical protein